MAAINWYLEDAADANGWQALSTTPQVAATIVGGWVVGTGATLHSEFAQGSERNANTFTGTTVPDGSLDATLHDAFRSPAPISGNFAAGNWEFHFVVRAVTNGGAQDGRVRFRLLKADADGGNATEITSGQQSASEVINVSTSADFDSTLTFDPGAFSIADQHIFIQVAWERTGAGGMTNSDINFRTGSSTSAGTRIVTTDLIATTAPFLQTEWPLPLLGGMLLVGLSSRPQDDGEKAFAQYDWPLPARSGRVVDLLTWLAPVITAEEEEAAPFAQTDWPLARFVVRADRTWTQPSIQEEGPAAAPFAQADWPLAGRAETARRGFTEAATRLLGQDEFFYGNRGPVYDWPNPVRQKSVYDFRTWTQAAIQEEAAPAESPFTQSDWPNPRQQKVATLKSFEDRVRLLLAGQDEFFYEPGRGPSYDWSNPKRETPSAVTNRSWVQNLLQSTLAPEPEDLPPSQHDWPLAPRGKGQLLISISTEPPSEDTGPTPFAQHQWPHVVRRPLAVDILVQGRAFTSEKPFLQADWPLPSPRRAKPAWDLTHTQGVPPGTPGLNPFGPHEWVNPQRKGYPTELRTFLREIIRIAGEQPYRQTDWPLVARRRETPTWLLRHTDTRDFFSVETKPFQQSIWVIPGQLPFLRGNLTHILGRPFYYEDPVEPPDVLTGLVCLTDVVPFEDRTFVTPGENRRLLVPFEQRELDAPEEPRTFTPPCCEDC